MSTDRLQKSRYNGSVFSLRPQHLFNSLAILISLMPWSLAAQPFDLDGARRAVVRVFGDRGNVVGSGSVLIVSKGLAYVLTAYHVIQADAQRGVSTVQVEFFPGGTANARIVRESIDETNDLAVVVVDKLPASPPAEISWGSSPPLQETERVWALGHPQGGPGWVMSDGTIGRKTRGRVYFSGTAVDAGNSGGPLLDSKGTMVGVIISKSGSQGVAVEADVARSIIRGWVPGLRVAAIPPSETPASQPPTPGHTDISPSRMQIAWRKAWLNFEDIDTEVRFRLNGYWQETNRAALSKTLNRIDLTMDKQLSDKRDALIREIAKAPSPGASPYPSVYFDMVYTKDIRQQLLDLGRDIRDGALTHGVDIQTNRKPQ
jgi:hypothetical protein